MTRSALLSLIAALSLTSACGGREEEAGPATDDVVETAAAKDPGPSRSAPAAPSGPEIAIPNAKSFQGHLVGGQPSPEQLQAAAKAGYEMVIGLQTEGEPGAAEVAATSKELGLDFVHIPIAGASGLNEENARALGDALERGQKEGKVMVVCRSGNRVGALFALKAHHVDGASPAEALAAGDEAGLTSLRGQVAELLGVTPQP